MCILFLLLYILRSRFRRHGLGEGSSAKAGTRLHLQLFSAFHTKKRGFRAGSVLIRLSPHHSMLWLTSPPDGYAWVYTCFCENFTTPPHTLLSSALTSCGALCGGIFSSSCVDEWQVCSVASFACRSVANDDYCVLRPVNEAYWSSDLRLLALLFLALSIACHASALGLRRSERRKRQEANRQTYSRARRTHGEASRSHAVGRRRAELSSPLHRIMRGRVQPFESRRRGGGTATRMEAELVGVPTQEQTLGEHRIVDASEARADRKCSPARPLAIIPLSTDEPPTTPRPLSLLPRTAPSSV